MNLLDENIPSEQRDLLRVAGIRCRAIGQDIAKLSIGDGDIISLLHRLKRPTLFTRDEDFFKRPWRHASYALVWLDSEAAMYIRRFLRHPRFQTKAQRMGAVARVHHGEFWQRNSVRLPHVSWLAL